MLILSKFKTHKFRVFGLEFLLRIAFATSLLTTGLSVQAQSSACAANEIQQTYSFAAPNNWPANSATIAYTLGTTPATTVNVTGTATLANISAGSPSTQPTGGFADSYSYIVNRTTTTATNSVTITFSKPINKLQLVATDLDYGVDANGSYQDRVTIVGTGPSGTVIPTAVATDPTKVGIAGNVATSLSTANSGNCPTTGAGSNLCNATFSFAQPITSFTYTYSNGPGATNNPPEQQVGMAALGYCIQNPDLSLVKDDGGASFVAGSTGTYTFTVSNVGSAPTSGTTTIKDILPAGMSFVSPLTAGGANGAALTCTVSTTTTANDTATCTTTTPIAAGASGVFTLQVSVAATVAGGTTLTNRAKVFGGNDPNKVAETTTGAISACPSDSLSGAVANAGCGFEATPITAAASVVITKTDSKTVAAPGATNNYVVTLTNQGPSVANGVIVTDVVGAGLTCPGANVVTCTGASCPAPTSTIGVLTGAGITVTSLPVGGSLQFAYTCNVN